MKLTCNRLLIYLTENVTFAIMVFVLSAIVPSCVLKHSGFQAAALDVQLGHDGLPELLSGADDSPSTLVDGLDLETFLEVKGGTSQSLLLLAQGIDQTEFVPLHRPQGDRQPFLPSNLPFLEPDAETQDDSSDASDESLYKISPGTTVGIPSAYGTYWRVAGIGVGVQERARFTDDADGGVGLAFGVGHPTENVALQIGIGFVDVTDPFADGSVGLKLHRQLPHDVAIALGATGVLTWGDTDGGSSAFGVVTKRFELKDSPRKFFSELTTSLGVGGGQFRSEAEITDGSDTVGVFGSAAIRIIEPVNGIVEWTGQDLTLGFSVVPFRNISLSITPAVADITGTAGDGPRFVAGVGYSFSF